MGGEMFQAERGQIKAVEAQAQKEKKDKVQSELKNRSDLFQSEVSKAGKLLADAEAKVSLPPSKEKVAAYKKDISGYLTQVAEKGREALKKEDPSAELTKISELAGSLKSSLENVKQYVPLFNDVEAAKAHVPKIADQLKKVAEAKEKSGMNSKEFQDAFVKAEELMGKAQESEIYLWKLESLPPEMQTILNLVMKPLKEQESEIAAYNLEKMSNESLKDDPNDSPEGKEYKNTLKVLKPAKAAFDAVQPKMKSIGDAVKESQSGKPEKLSGMSGDVDSAITDLGAVLKQLQTIDKSKISDPLYVTLYENTLSKVNLQIQELANVKVSLKTREMMKNGLTEDEKKCFSMNSKGFITKTAEFNKLPKEKQMALDAKFKLIAIEVSMDLDEKTAGEKEKKMIEGRKKLMGGDPFGAKEDLLAYYNQEAKNTERDPVRFEQAREMLKQIAKMELAQMVGRLAQMKESIKGRYNNSVPGGKTDFGTRTYDQAYDNIDNMARVIEAAEELIESGKAVTIEGAESQLRKFEFPPNSVEGVQAMDEKAAEIKQRKDKDLEKNKEDRVQKAKDDVTRQEDYLKKLAAGEIQMTLSGDPVTPELIAKEKARLEQLKGNVKTTEGMSLEEVRAAELAPVERNLKRAKLDQALKSWKLGFPVDATSNSYEVFDMFVQQRKLNSADPEQRKQAYLDQARLARERGFTSLAKSMYEEYFKKELQAGAKTVDKEKVRTETLAKPEVKEQLGKQVESWKKAYEKQWHRAPTDAEVSEARGKMENMVAGEAYTKAVKLSTFSIMNGASGPAAAEWKKVYGKTVALEDFGQGANVSVKFGGESLVDVKANVGAGGVLASFWTDEEWNALPTKVGVFTAVTIASGGLGSAAAAGAGMATRAVLGEAVVGRLLTSGAGRAAAWLGDVAVEGAVFSAAQYELNGLIEGHQYERFSAEYWKAMGHSVVTMGVLKGVGTGVGKVRNSRDAAKMAKYFEEGGLVSESAVQSGAALKAFQGPGLMTEGAWWLSKTSLEGGALVGLDAGTAFLTGREFSTRQAMKSFGENFLFSAAMGGVHSFMGHGAAEGPAKEKTKEEVATSEAVGKYSKSLAELDVARAKLEKAKADKVPYAKLEAEVALKEAAAKAAEGKLSEAEKSEERSKSAIVSHYSSSFSHEIPDEMKAEGKSGKDVAGWIDKEGKIHYSTEYFKEKFGVEMSQSKDGKNVFIVEGKEISPLEFFRTPDGKNVLGEMKRVKTHEVTHRSLELFDGASGGELGKSLQKLVSEHPELAAEFGKRGEEMGTRSVQEFLCEVADGREKQLTPEAIKTIEAEIGKVIPHFSFKSVRKIDTLMLRANSPEVFKRNMADAFTAENIIDNPVFQDVDSKRAFDLYQKALKASLDPTKRLSKADLEKAQVYSDALDRKKQVQSLMADRANIVKGMDEHNKAYEKFKKLDGDISKVAAQAEADMLSALKEGDYQKAQKIKESFASIPGFTDALTYVEYNFRFKKGNREISVLDMKTEMDAEIRSLRDKSPEEIATFVENFNLEHPGFREGQRIKICDLPGGKGWIEVTQKGELIYINPYEDAPISDVQGKKKSKKDQDFDEQMDLLFANDGLKSAPPRPLKSKLTPAAKPVAPASKEKPTSKKPGDEGPEITFEEIKDEPAVEVKSDIPMEPIKPMPIIDIKPQYPTGFDAKYAGTPLEPFETWRAKRNIAPDVMSPEQLRDAVGKLDAFDKEILENNVAGMSPDQIVAVLKKRYTELPDGSRYYEGKLAGQGGIAVVHLAAIYKPGKSDPVEAVVKTPSTHDKNGRPYTPEEYAGRKMTLGFEAYNARRIKALQEGHPPQLLKTMRPIHIEDDKIVYQDAYAGKGKFRTYEEAVEDPRVGSKTLLLGVADTFDALAEMHENRLVHRDIKPENLALAEMKPIEVIDANGNKSIQYVDASGRILDIGSVQNLTEMKADKMMISFSYIDASGNEQFYRGYLDPSINSSNYEASISAIAKKFNIGADTIGIYPSNGGVTDGYYDPKMIMAIQEGKIPPHLQDYYALGQSLQKMTISGLPKYDKNDNYIGLTPPKEVPPEHKAEMQRIIRGLTSYDPSNPDYQYVHNTLGGIRGVSKRFREWYNK